MSWNWWESFEFIWPWMLAFLPLPWLIRPFLKPAPEQQQPLLAPQIWQALQAESSMDWQPLQRPQTRNRLPWLFILIWLGLILAAMRPVWYLTPTPFEATGRDLVLSVDLSGSMEKPDMLVQGRAVDRLTALKTVVDEFIQQRRGDRMALVAFGSQAFMISPLTYDLNAVRQLLAEAQIGMAGNNTAIGDAIGLTLKHLQNHRNQKAVLILLTDGSNNAGSIDPMSAAKKAQQVGLMIHTIAFGNTDPGRGRSADDIDTETLKTVAELTGGQSFLASRTEDLAKIYQRINEMESSEFTLNQYRARTELYTWPLGLVLLIGLTWMAWRLHAPTLRS
jgi:Ca-activated chloride channel family protein